jgi:glycosyltransferase involved in cell wall biosynthesis
MKKALLISESSVYRDENAGLIVRGGGALCFHNIAKSLLSLGIEPTVLSIREFDGQKVDEIIDGVIYRRVAVSSRASFWVLKYLNAALKDARDYDLVFLNQFTPHLLLPRLKNDRIIAVIHDVYRKNGTRFWIKQFGLFVGFMGAFVERLQLYFDKKYAHKIMTVSEGSKAKIVDVLGNSVAKKIVVNPYPIDVSEFKSLVKKKEYLLFVGRFVSYKHPEHVLTALKVVKRKYPQYRAVFVVPREFEKVRKLFEITRKRLKLSNKDVELVYCCDGEKLKELLAGAKLLLQPSFVEGQGIVVLEALASMTPVVAYNLPAYRGMLENGQNSLMVESGNVAAFSEACLEILANYDAYRDNCHTTLFKFSNASFMKKLKMLL